MHSAATPCAATDCNTLSAGDYCSKHQRKLEKYGDPNHKNKKLSIEQRLEKYSSKQPNGCVYWAGARNKGGRTESSKTCGGRGHLKVDGYMISAHRLMWERHHGPVPDGKLVLHNCHNGHHGCIAIDHLYLGSHADNMQDMVDAKRSLYGEKSPHAKLTESKVRSIRSDYASGDYSYRDLAAKYGVAYSGIGRVIRSERWKHVKI